MPEEAGKLTVRYQIISSKAEAALNRISAKLKQVEDYAIKSGKQIAKSMKAGAVAFAAFGGIVVGVLYSVIRGSSYAAMWTDQFSMSMKKLYDHILEVTGLGDTIDEFLEKFDAFVDILKGEGLKAWFADLSTIDKILLVIIVTIGIIIVAVGVFIAVGLGILAVSAVITGAVAGFAALAAAIATIPIWIAVIIGLVLGMIIVWVLWKTGILTAIADLGARFGTWVKDLGARFATWVAGLGEKFGNWVTKTKEKLSKFKTWMGDKFDAAWDYIITGLTNMKDSFFGIIDMMINKLATFVSDMISAAAKMVGFGGDDEDGVYATTSSTTKTSGWATGGHITRSGVAGVHAGEDIVRLKSLLSGIRTDQAGGGTSRSVVNNVTVNVSSSMSNSFEIDDMVDKVSRKLTAELGRISTSI